MDLQKERIYSSFCLFALYSLLAKRFTSFAGTHDASELEYPSHRTRYSLRFPKCRSLRISRTKYAGSPLRVNFSDEVTCPRSSLELESSNSVKTRPEDVICWSGRTDDDDDDDDDEDEGDDEDDEDDDDDADDDDDDDDDEWWGWWGWWWWWRRW